MEQFFRRKDRHFLTVFDRDFETDLLKRKELTVKIYPLGV